MNTLPIELVDIILHDAGALVRPVLGCVCKEWHNLVLKRRPKKRFHENRPCIRRLLSHVLYRHQCTSSTLCAIFYMSRLIDAGHWCLFDWMVATPYYIYETQCCEYVQRYVCTQLAAHGDMVRLRTLRETHRFQWDTDAVSRAARYGHLDMVKWLYSELGWVRDVSNQAARGGHLSVLQWTLEMRFGWSVQVCGSAARGGHLNVLQWLRANGCPWDSRTTAEAARNAHLHVLSWAIANGCPVGATAMDMAAQIGHLDIVQWLIANEFPQSTHMYNSALKGDHMQVAEWLYAQGHLLDHGGEANGVDDVRALEWLSERGYSFDTYTLWYAAWTKCPNAIKWLIERGLGLASMRAVTLQ